MIFESPVSGSPRVMLESLRLALSSAGTGSRLCRFLSYFANIRKKEESKPVRQRNEDDRESEERSYLGPCLRNDGNVGASADIYEIQEIELCLGDGQIVIGIAVSLACFQDLVRRKELLHALKPMMLAHKALS